MKRRPEVEVGLPSSLEPLEESVPASILRAEVQAWARRVGVEPTEIHIRAMTTKWASCSSAGRLTFARSLLQQPARFRSEAILHEVLHLRVPNHGRLFKTLFRTLIAEKYPDSDGPASRLPVTAHRDGR